MTLLDAVFASEEVSGTPPYSHGNSESLTIIYTSGTSGEPKGVVLDAGNVNHMLGCTNARLDQLMAMTRAAGTARQRLSLPAVLFCRLVDSFALTALSRNSVLTLSTDLSKLSEELKLAAPNYFLNVPTLLERVRTKIEESIRKRGGLAAGVFARAQRGYLGRHGGETRHFDWLCLSIANAVMFPTIRKSIGPNLRAIICGSAPLAVETQLFFMMLGISVLQVYGLTETTAICTMDNPRRVEPGSVGPAIPGIEMRAADSGEILVRGPNIFPGYWQRTAETARALQDGWFHTGDRGEVDANGNWRITGRLKNLIVLNSGHKMAPEPIEQELATRLPEAQQVVLVGNQRSFLAALVTVAPANGLHGDRVQAAVDAMNAGAAPLQAGAGILCGARSVQH